MSALKCDNIGDVVPCTADATRAIRLRSDDGDIYEAHLCEPCFFVFRADMVAHGLTPTNERATPPGSSERGGE